MADPIALRRPVLAEPAPSGTAATAVISAATVATRILLRLAPSIAAAAGVVAGFDLTGRLNTVIGAPERFAARLGPDEWLLVAPDGEAAALVATVAAELAGAFHSAVDVSHRNAALTLAGAAVAEVLNAGCPLDLSDAAFPPGSASRTVLGKAEIVLIRPGDGSVWRVECGRSFAPYVRAFLAEAAV